MNYYPDGSNIYRLNREQNAMLVESRRLASIPRAEKLIERKAKLLNSYLRAYGLRSCVVGVSGGIDSALVLGLAKHASTLADSPIARIVPVLLPVHDQISASGQLEATARGYQCCSAMGLDPCEIDITPVHAVMRTAVENAMRHEGKGWSSGQLVSYQRTPALYYVTSLLSEQGIPGIVLGTTNYDEGSYIGYFGKASDGMTDVQMISDLHKHEVWRMAQLLNVPKDILDAVPTGDMYDARSDEQVFGFTYDALEFDLRYRYGALDVDSSVYESDTLHRLVDDLHRYNHHKYMGKSPAVHLDVIRNRKFQGSWDYYVWDEKA